MCFIIIARDFSSLALVYKSLAFCLAPLSETRVISGLRDGSSRRPLFRHAVDYPDSKLSPSRDDKETDFSLGVLCEKSLCVLPPCKTAPRDKFNLKKKEKIQ